MYDALHKDEPFHDGKEQSWSKTPDRIHRFHYRDGVTIYLAETDENPDDNFLQQQREPGVLFGNAGTTRDPERAG